jgi:branched-chain amino acid transport system substrate-binding protein
LKRLDSTRLAAAALAAAALTLGLAACGGSNDSGSSGKWRIGLEAPLTGDQQSIGQGMLNGAQLAAGEINDGGGLQGKDVEIVPIDDAADPKTGVAAANQAIDAGLDGVIGPYNSGVGVKTLPLYIKAGLVPVRLTSDDATNGEGFTASALTDSLNPKTVAIGYDPSQIYTKTVSSSVKKALEGSGITVTAYEAVKPGGTSYADVVRRLAAGKPDAIYWAVYSPEGGLIAKAMLQQKVRSKCLLDYATYDTGYIDSAGLQAAMNCPVVGVPAPNDFPGSAGHVSAYQDQFGDAPGVWSPYTYDSLNFLAYGVEKAGGFGSQELTKALNGVDGWMGWTGSVTIDPSNGNRQPATVVVDSVDAKGEFHEAWSKGGS